MEKRIDAAELRARITRLYHSAGVPEADAQLIADSLVQAELWGHQSHGVLRTGWYLARLRSGSVAAEVVRHAHCPVVLFRPPRLQDASEPTAPTSRTTSRLIRTMGPTG